MTINLWKRALALAGLLLLLAVPAARAHTRVTVGPYAIVVGWVTEPPIVGERNALFFEITEDGAPVTGAEAGLRAVIQYGGRTFQANLNPVAERPGEYTAELVPTIRGQYSVQLTGSLGDLAVDETIEPEEVFPADRLQFPEPQPDARALQQELRDSVAALEAQLRTARLLAIGGLVLGLAGLGVGAAGWRARR
ncbi:MAG: hypothetical protein KC425_00875 [Anaerolineales bacterium]|nr:hypothetical protein [Anaerolineales bacterium]